MAMVVPGSGVVAPLRETGPEGLETWEALQKRQLQLALRKELGRVETLEEVEPWETDLNEPWSKMQIRLEVQLKANSLDHENKPFSVLTGKGITDNKTTAGIPTNIIWLSGASGDDEGDSSKPNSDHLMGALKLWGLELPGITLLVHGGSSHPWQLIRVQQIADQRADFLKSRPRFNDTYFDGQRDAAQGWMANGNAWRYPVFYISPSYNPSEFTFRPPQTLFVDAALQVQEDHELIETGDRTMNEWIMDAVTHQPIGRQAAIKGADGVFYWDLNAPSLHTTGVISIDADLRKSYFEWKNGSKNMVIEEARNEGGFDMIKSKFLIGSTKRRSIDRWGSMTARLLLHERQKAQKDEDNQLAEGEIRVEINSFKLNKTGQQKLASLMPTSSLGLGSAMDDMVGAMTMNVMSGDVLCLVKLSIPGDDILVSDPVRLGRGPAIKVVKIGLSKRSHHSAGSSDQAMKERQSFLQDVMSSKNPAESLLRIAVVLTDALGEPIKDEQGRDLELGAFEQSLKEMVQDVPCDDHGTFNMDGEIDFFNAPPPKEVKAGAKEKKPKPAKVQPSPARVSRSDGLPEPPPLNRSKSKGSFGRSRTQALTIDDGSGSLSLPPPPPLEKPVSMGKINGRVAIRPPTTTKTDLHTDSGAAALSAKTSQLLKNRPKVAQVAPEPPGVDRNDDGMPSNPVPPVRAVRNAPTISFDDDDPFSPRLLGPPKRMLAPRAAPTLPRELTPMSAGGPEGRSPSFLPEFHGSSLVTSNNAMARSPQTAPPTAPRFERPPPGLSNFAPGASSGPSMVPSLQQSRVVTPAPELLAPIALSADVMAPFTEALALPLASSDTMDTLPPQPSPPASPPADGLAPALAKMSMAGTSGVPGGGASGRDSVAESVAESGADDDDADGGVHIAESSNVFLLAGSIKKNMDAKHTVVYTVAYWIMWKTVETIGDQRLLFGDAMNQPVLVRGNKLGALVNNYFCATDYDPRWNGENWQLVVVTNDGAFSKFYVGFSSDDETGLPEPAKAEEPTPGRPVCDVKTEVGGHVAIRKLYTTGKGAGLLAQAWIWPRDLQQDEVRELWMQTKGRYPVAKRGVSSLAALPFAIPGGVYRVPPNPFAGDTQARAEAKKEKENEKKEQELQKLRRPAPQLPKPPPPSMLRPTSIVAAKVIEKDMAAMLDVPLVNKLAFQRLLNVFSVLVDYAIYSNSFICIDRVHNFSCTAELMLELALRKNPTVTPVVLVIDCKARLEKANHKLKELKRARFLRESCQVTSTEFLNASLRNLVTPQGLTWLRASSADLAKVTFELESRIDDEKRLDAQHVKDIYELYGEEGDLRRDGRPNQDLIWKSFYAASLFASGTHYMIFDQVEMRGRSVLGTLGTVGCIFMSGGTQEHTKIVDQIQSGAPLLLLESTGGVTQAFAHAMKTVRMMKPKWPVDYVLRLVTEYKIRAADQRDRSVGSDPQAVSAKHKMYGLLHLENIHLLDKELARIDLLLSSEEKAEAWMRAFGLPEILMLFELWQRASAFLRSQLQMADVMKISAEGLLDTFTAVFSSPGGVPELGLGNAEKKVVATAWNRHLLLFHNGDKYNARSWMMQLILYIIAIATTALAIFSTTFPGLEDNTRVKMIMLVLPIAGALLTTISTRLRQKQKFSQCKMASFTIVSEIYKFRVRAIEYDPLALSAAVAAMEGGDDKKDEDAMPKPISSKERDKIARRMFVSRVKNIYSTCMAAELATGTSISHKSSFGLDPARLLRDYEPGAEDDEKETTKMLQSHVAEKLYYIKNLEWERGAEGYKEQRARVARLRSARLRASVKNKVTSVYITVARLVVGLVAELERRYLEGKAKAQYKMAVARGEVTDETKDKFRIKYSAEGDKSASDEAAAAKSYNPRELTKIQQLMEYYRSRAGKGASEAVIEKVEKVEKLDETYRIPDDDEDQGDDEMGGGDAGGGRPGDDLFGPLTIDDYMRYRARPVCTYLERTAPWRAFELQTLEIIIFIIQSLGAVLVGIGNDTVPYVSLTVAIAAVLKSLCDFANLEKQVESYNTALREVHGMLNDWDGKTRTERRTRQVISSVVGTVEGHMTNVAVALCDAQPDNAGGEEEEGEGEKKDE